MINVLLLIGVYGVYGETCVDETCDSDISTNEWCDSSKFDLNGPYNECLNIMDQQERQKCVANVAFSNVAFPNSYFIITMDEVVPWFTDDIVGRITPTGIFPDYQQNVDYLYGIASSSSLLLGCEKPGVVPFKSYPHYLTSEGDIVSVRFDYTMGNYPINDCTMNFTLSGFMRFNDEGNKIKSYDFTLQRWGLAVAEINKCRGGQEMELGVDFICAVEASKCITNTSQQYDHDFSLREKARNLIFNNKAQFGADFANHPGNVIEGLPECREFLNGLDQGTWDHVITNTITCRVLHSFLAIVHPDIHCKHIGQSGGMACKDYEYDFYYNQIY
eukprot:CAMPEP_0201584808 /NCGR_PEP_ID=MMETSP0190_2-20130828/115120_1 /ASSEMBLY_ACC=CAM_ASM_000263 /TAXON_ID=37353 /ORGANISM="Rosalina sp." /LENGTH=330 /DNA_ID=CAMNT_0048029537 /DNA_START=85 /DNA_END=1077 /DNA_ORIENTATION=-